MIDVPIQVIGGLPFITVIIHANGRQIQLNRMLLDTGSGGTVVKADHLVGLGVVPLPEDRLHFLQGIGGDEAVIEKQIDALQIGAFIATSFVIEMGAVDYGTPMDGIVGLDFLLRARAIIDFEALQIR